MNQLSLPYEEITKVAGRTYLRDKFTVSSRVIYKIPVKKLQIREGFNKRTVYEGIEELAASIKLHGLQEPLTVDVIPDGRVFIEKGHRRFKAIQLLIEQGEKIKEVECHPNLSSVTELERMQNIYTSNMHSCQLTALEQAAVVFDLKHNFGVVPNETIGGRLGISRQKVDQLLLISQAPDDIKDQIKQKTMGITEACELIREQKRSVKQADQKEKESHVSPTSVPAPKDELAKDVKELDELEKPTEAENWWANEINGVKVCLIAEYFGDDHSQEVSKEQIEVMYSGVQAAEELEELLKVSDEIKVRDNTIREHIGRKLSSPVIRSWVHDYVENGEPQSRDIDTEIVSKNIILTEDIISLILETAEIDSIFVYKQGMEPVAASVITEPVAEKEKDKYDMGREEIAQVQNCVKLADKLEAIVTKLDVPDGTKKDVADIVKWLQKDLAEVREWMHKNKKQNKAR